MIKFKTMRPPRNKEHYIVKHHAHSKDSLESRTSLGRRMRSEKNKLLTNWKKFENRKERRRKAEGKEGQKENTV